MEKTMAEQEKKPSRFFNWLYIPIIAPLVVIFFGSFIAGKIIIQITGFQLSIGLTILVIVCIFIAMVISFYVGMVFPIVAIFGFFVKDKREYPILFRMISGFALIVMFPFVLYEKLRQKRFGDQKSTPEGSPPS